MKYLYLGIAFVMLFLCNLWSFNSGHAEGYAAAEAIGKTKAPVNMWMPPCTQIVQPQRPDRYRL